MADGIDYHAKNLGWMSWEMTAYVYRGSEAIPVVVASTWAPSLRALRVTVAREHTEVRARAARMLGTHPTAPGVLIGANILALLDRDATATLQVVHERHGWLATVTVAGQKPSAVFRPSAAEAMRLLDERVSARYAPAPVVIDPAPVG